MNNLTLLRLVAFSLFVSLAGCETIEEADERLEDLTQVADRSILATEAVTASSSIVHKSTPYLGDVSLLAPIDRRLPDVFEGDDGIVVFAQRSLTIKEIADRITKATGLPTYVDTRVLSANTDSTSVPEISAAPTDPIAAIAPPAFNDTTPTARRDTQYEYEYQPDFTGSLSRFLDIIAYHFDMSWSFENGTIFFNRYTTRTFLVKVPLSTNSFDVTVKGATGSQGSGEQGASATFSGDQWAELDDTLASLIPDGSSYSVSQSTGVLTVTTTSRAMEAVATHVERINEILSKRVAVEVAAIFINIDDQDDFGLSIDALFQDAVSGLNVAQRSLVPALSQIGSTSIGILDATDSPNSKFNGTELMLRAVSSNDRLADYRIGTTIAQSNTVTPITLTREQDIVNRISTVNEGIGIVTSTAQTETLNIGFSLQVLPRVVGDNEVHLTLALASSDLTALENFQVSAQQTIQLATVDARQLKNEVVMSSGETLILSGYEQERVVRGDTGLGSSDLWFLGGEKSGQIQRTRLILMVTPTIVGEPQPTRVANREARHGL
ncbi:MAG: hypothetical protein RJS97_04970 [Parvibaculaceae bacterium]